MFFNKVVVLSVSTKEGRPAFVFLVLLFGSKTRYDFSIRSREAFWIFEEEEEEEALSPGSKKGGEPQEDATVPTDDTMIAPLCLRDDDDDGEERVSERARERERDRSPPKNQRKKEGCFFSFFFVSFFCTEKTTLSDSFVTHHHYYYLLLLLLLLSSQQQQKQQQKQQHNTRRSVVTRADWSLGSDVNHCVCFNTVALLFAGRFGFAPTVKKNYSGADSYTMTEDAKPAVGTRDPAGFTAVDVLAFGSLAHIVSAGEIFGLHLN